MTVEVTIPDDMKPWHGGNDGPPADWRRGWKVLHRNGRMGSINVESASLWQWDADDPDLDVIAYPVATRLGPMAELEDNLAIRAGSTGDKG